jgi:hypothetical protein
LGFVGIEMVDCCCILCLIIMQVLLNSVPYYGRHLLVIATVD